MRVDCFWWVFWVGNRWGWIFLMGMVLGWGSREGLTGCGSFGFGLGLGFTGLEGRLFGILIA